MKELRETIKNRLKGLRQTAASAGDRRDWDATTAAEASIGELEWVLRELEKSGTTLKVETTHVFKEPVTYEQSATFDGDVFVGGDLVVNGVLTCVGFNVT